MKCIIFDTSTIISIVTNNMLPILTPLKKKYGGDFCMPLAVKAEIITRPLQSKKFKFEAMQVISKVADGTLRLEEEPIGEADKILQISNGIFMAHDHYIQVLHSGEAAALALAKKVGADAIAIDERTTRLMIESPETVAKILGQKLHTRIKINKDNLKMFRKYIDGLTVIRSAEIGVIAYEMGLFDQYIPPKSAKMGLENPKKDLLDAVLWGVKLRGCAIGSDEIDQILRSKGF